MLVKTLYPAILFTEDPKPLFSAERLYAKRNGEPGRKLIDNCIAKVVPAGSNLKIIPINETVARVVDSRYHRWSGDGSFFIFKVGLDKSKGEKIPRRLSLSQIIERLKYLVDYPYLLGGTSPKQTLELQTFLIQQGITTQEIIRELRIEQVTRAYGVDCSGLLNYAYNYHWLGDSQHLPSLGSTLPLEKATTAESIVRQLNPLDIIAFKGHMIIYLGDNEVIQAVGVGENAELFAKATGFTDQSIKKYNRVVIDTASQIIQGLLESGKKLTNKWIWDGKHFMIIRPKI